VDRRALRYPHDRCLAEEDGLGTRQQQPGERVPPNAKEERYHDTYIIWTRTHPYFEDLRERWYPDGDKQFPDDLELTPLRAKLWYLCDGYLDVGRWGRPRLETEVED
jgi:hypothetical protein